MSKGQGPHCPQDHQLSKGWYISRRLGQTDRPLEGKVIGFDVEFEQLSSQTSFVGDIHLS
jgi:hypothetical protein